MTAWTSPATWAAATLTAAQLNEQLRDDARNLDERLALHGILSSTRLAQVRGALVGVRCTSGSDQSVATSTDVALTWSAEAYDSDGFHSTASNTSRVTIPSGMGGVYLVSAVVEWNDVVTADTTLSIRDDGGTVLARARSQNDGPSGHNRYQTLTATVVLAAADWVEAVVSHNLGITATVRKGQPGCGLSAWRIAAS